MEKHIMHSLLFPVVALILCFSACVKEQKVNTTIIIAKPKIMQQDQFLFLVVSDSIKRYDFLLRRSPDIQFLPISLDTNMVYIFEVAITTRDGIKMPILQKITLGGQEVYDASICEIHKRKMAYKKVPIKYGLIRFGPGEPSPETQKMLFPHFRECSYGGCCIGLDNPKTEFKYVCDECKKAKRKWEKSKYILKK